MTDRMFLGIFLLFSECTSFSKVERIRITWSSSTATAANIIWDGGKAKQVIIPFIMEPKTMKENMNFMNFQ